MAEEFFRYKDYIGSIEHDLDTKMLRGRIEFITDMVNYTAETLTELEKEFRIAVDDYIATCAEIGKEPNKTFSGTFNVRIGPERHEKVAVSAKVNKRTLNDEIKNVIDGYYAEQSRQVHLHFHDVYSVEIDYSKMKFKTVPIVTKGPDTEEPKVGIKH